MRLVGKLPVKITQRSELLLIIIVIVAAKQVTYNFGLIYNTNSISASSWINFRFMSRPHLFVLSEFIGITLYFKPELEIGIGFDSSRNISL